MIRDEYKRYVLFVGCPPAKMMEVDCRIKSDNDNGRWGEGIDSGFRAETRDDSGRIGQMSIKGPAHLARKGRVSVTETAAKRD